MRPDDIPYATAVDLVRAYGAGGTTPAAVTDRLLARIDALNPRLNAFIRVHETAARAEAEAATARWRAGVPIGPLDGVPVALKDLVEVKGTPTGGGSAALADRISPVDATILARIRAAGMIVLGKTQMVEFACGGWGTNHHLGTPVNPWDPATHRAPGGSSSGSGVAVAAGLAPLAIGSDTGGSVRIPAAFNGLTGLKTTVGRVSNAGTLPLAKTFDTIGPMARDAVDAALFYEVLRGPDPGDPMTLAVPPDAPLAAIEDGIRGMRLGILPESEHDGVASDVLAAYEAAIRTLEGLGARIETAPLPEAFDAVRPRCGTLIMAEGYAWTRQWIDRDDLPLDPNVRARLLGGSRTAAADYVLTAADRQQTKAAWRRALDGVDAVITPTTPIAAPPVATIDETAFTAARFTRAGNYLDWCGAAVPMGVDGDGLPLSLQINCDSLLEHRALRIARAFQGAGDWHGRHPAIAEAPDTPGTH